MKIFYLNANNFFGDSSIKNLLFENGGGGRKVIGCRTDGLNKLISKLLLEKIDLNYDMIFLSEIDPYSEATKEFVETMKNKNYEYVFPNAGMRITKNHYSITVCFIKKEISDQWLDDGKSNLSPKDWLRICQIGNNNRPLVLGIHLTDLLFEDLKKQVEDCKDKAKRFICFGDTNINPEDSGKEREFQKIIEKLAAKEVIDSEEGYTYRNLTRIDRVITNIDNVTMRIDNSVYTGGLSDHGALIIDIPDA